MADNLPEDIQHTPFPLPLWLSTGRKHALPRRLLSFIHTTRKQRHAIPPRPTTTHRRGLFSSLAAKSQVHPPYQLIRLFWFWKVTKMDKMRIHEPTTPEAPNNENYETDVWDVWKESSTCSCEGCLKIPLFASLIPLNYTESYDDSPLTSAANQFLFMSEYELNTVTREIEVAYRPFVLANAETLTHGYFDPGILRDEIED
ncbi:hypothetical protein DL95DRAFT_486212 [Leptodontidium sp. 2 PMI_412]|nr:hypothetical protein DL95DRAFT_486212 [Leptodontidium sp. 2 PMI_412]